MMEQEHYSEELIQSCPSDQVMSLASNDSFCLLYRI